MVLGVKVSYRQTKADIVHVHIMASEQTNTNEAIAQAVAKATKATIQTMAVAGAERAQNVVPRLGKPVMKQPTFNGKA